MILLSWCLLFSLAFSLTEARLEFAKKAFEANEADGYAEILILRSGKVGREEVAYLDALGDTAVDAFDFVGFEDKKIVLNSFEESTKVKIELFDNYWNDGTRLVNLKLKNPDRVDQAVLFINDDEEPEDSNNLVNEPFLNIFKRLATITATQVTTTSTTVPPTTSVETSTSTTSVETSTSTTSTSTTPITTTTVTTTTTTITTTTACIMGCDNRCNSGMVLDACKVCGPPVANGTSPHLDCANVCFGSSYINECALCVDSQTDVRNECGLCGDDRSCYGCDGVPFGKKYDACGVCGGNSTTCTAFTSISPVAERNVDGIVITLFGAGFLVNGVARNLSASFNTSGANANLTAVVLSASTARVTLNPFPTTGPVPVSLLINGEVPQANSDNVTYYVLPDMSLNPGIFELDVGATGLSISLTGSGITQVPNIPVRCHFFSNNTIFNSSSLITSTTATLVSSTNVTCPAPSSSTSKAIWVQVSVNNFQSFIPIVNSGSIEVHYFAAAPYVVDARFGDSGATVSVSLSTPVALIQGTLVIGASIPCSSLFNQTSVAKFGGSGALCMFDSNQRITIILGSSATLIPGDLIQLLLVIKLSGVVPFQRPYNPIWFPVNGPNNLPIPVAVISAPQLVSTCQNFTVSGILSTGSAGRSLEYLWSVDPPIPSIAPFLTNSTFLVSPLANGTYVFSLQVKSFLATSAVVSFTVTVSSNLALPAVTIKGSDPREVYRENDVLLDAVVSLPCITSATITFRWTIRRIDGTNESFPFLNTQTTTSLRIPAFTLTHLAVYNVTIFATPANSGVSGQYTVVVRVLPSPVSIQIVGSSIRPVSTGSRIPLQANLINYSGNSRACTYQWTCYNPVLQGPCPIQNSLNPLSFLVRGSTLNPTTSPLLITENITSSLIQSSSIRYVLTLTVATFDGAPNATAQIELVVTDGSSFSVDLTANYDTKFFLSGRELTITASPNGGVPPYVYTWSTLSVTLSRFGVSVPSGTLDITQNILNAPINGSLLIFKVNTLLPGVSYMFHVSAVDSKGTQGWGSLQVDVAPKPTSGRLTFTPETGKAASTPFTISLLDWTTEPADLPLTYSFRFDYSPTGRISYPRGADNIIDTTLPQPVQQVNVSVVGMVFGASGESATVVTQIPIVTCVPANTAALTALKAEYTNRLNFYKQVGAYKEARAYILNVAVCLLGGYASKKRDISTRIQRDYPPELAADVNLALNGIAKDAVDILANLVDDPNDNLINICAMDVLSSQPTQLYQNLSISMGEVLRNQALNLVNKGFTDIETPVMDCFIRSSGNTLSGASFSSLDPNVTVPSSMFHATAEVISRFGAHFLTTSVCGRDPFNFPEVSDHLNAVTWSIQRGSLQGRSLNIPAAFTARNSSSFKISASIPNTCYCASAVAVAGPIMSFVGVPQPPANATQGDNSLLAGQNVGLEAGGTNDPFDYVNNPTNGGFNLSSQGFVYTLRQCQGTIAADDSVFNLVEADAIPFSFTLVSDSGPFNIAGTYVCVFYNETSGEWDSSGVTTLSVQTYQVTCQSTHLTTFALLQQIDTSLIPSGAPPPAPFAASTIALIAVLVGIAAIALLIIGFIYLRRRKTDEERLNIEINTNRVLDFNVLNEEDPGLEGIAPPTLIGSPIAVVPIPEPKKSFLRPPPYIPPPTYDQFLGARTKGAVVVVESSDSSSEETETETETDTSETVSDSDSGSESGSGSDVSEETSDSDSESGSGSEDDSESGSGSDSESGSGSGSGSGSEDDSESGSEKDSEEATSDQETSEEETSDESEDLKESEEETEESEEEEVTEHSEESDDESESGGEEVKAGKKASRSESGSESESESGSGSEESSGEESEDGSDQSEASQDESQVSEEGSEDESEEDESKSPSEESDDSN